MTERPTITAVIPTYNSQETIRAALESVYTQTVVPDEVLVIDDESSDNTCAIVTSNFPQATLIKKHNGGPSSARNLGIKNARCEWIAFLDADDIWSKDKCERQLDVIKNHSKAVLIASHWSSSAHGLLEREQSRPEIIPEKLLWTSEILVLNRFQTSTVMARRAQLEQCGGFLTELDGAEDWDMWLRLSKLGHVVLLEEPLVYYRDTDGGFSKDLMRLMKAMELMMKRESGQSTINPRLVRRIWAWHYLRFMVGFLLVKDMGGAKESLRSAIRAGLWPQLPTSAWNYLLPFLGSRLRRRIAN
jgi:glycosyltransferase involved in cell wall biosynthesis